MDIIRAKALFFLCYGNIFSIILVDGGIMYPCLLLRDMISEKYGIDLSQYAWSQEFTDLVMSIQLDYNFENTEYNVGRMNLSTGNLLRSLKDVYEKGLNIGNCALTARYLLFHPSIVGANAFLHRGTCSLISGTKNAGIKGNHAWCESDGYVIDTTLMLCIPVSDAIKLGYNTTSVLARPFFPRVGKYDIKSRSYCDEVEAYLPEYNCFSDAYVHYGMLSPEYWDSIFRLEDSDKKVKRMHL